MPDEVILILTLMPIAFLGSLVYGVTVLVAAMVGLTLATLAFKHVSREFLLRMVAVLLLANGIFLVARAASLPDVPTIAGAGLMPKAYP